MTHPLVDQLRFNRSEKVADPYLDTLTTKTLQSDLLLNGESVGQSIGSAMRSITYHQQKDLPEYVSDIEIEAPYRPE